MFFVIRFAATGLTFRNSCPSHPNWEVAIDTRNTFLQDSSGTFLRKKEPKHTQKIEVCYPPRASHCSRPLGFPGKVQSLLPAHHSPVAPVSLTQACVYVAIPGERKRAPWQGCALATSYPKLLVDPGAGTLTYASCASSLPFARPRRARHACAPTLVQRRSTPEDHKGHWTALSCAPGSCRGLQDRHQLGTPHCTPLLPF